MRLGRRTAALAAAAALCGPAVGGCGLEPAPAVNTGQAILDLGDALNDLREESALLQGQIDSLRTVVARQDTAIRRLSALTGVPVP